MPTRIRPPFSGSTSLPPGSWHKSPPAKRSIPREPRQATPRAGWWPSTVKDAVGVRSDRVSFPHRRANGTDRVRSVSERHDACAGTDELSQVIHVQSTGGRNHAHRPDHHSFGFAPVNFLPAGPSPAWSAGQEPVAREVAAKAISRARRASSRATADRRPGWVRHAARSSSPVRIACP